MRTLAHTLLGNQADACRSRLETAHTLAAAAFGVGLGLPITPMELAGIPLVLITIARLPETHRQLAGLIREPFTLALLAWIAWALAALAWSPDRAQGLDELANARWLWILPALWLAPHLARPVLIGIAAGFVLMHISQATQLVLQAADNPWIAEQRRPDRISGWSQPAVAGSLLCAILGLHLPRAMFAADWARRALAVLALVGLIATGTRGAWIVAALLLFHATATLGLLGISSVRYRTRAIVVITTGAIVVTAAILSLSDVIESRIDEAHAEIAAALEDGNKHTSTGGRIVMNQWAIEAVRAEPAVGVGTGGYNAWVTEQQHERGIDPRSQRVLDHAHNTYLHIAATQGLVGLALYLAVAGLALRSAWTATPEHAGVFVALMALLLIGAFDTIPVNAQTSALAATLAAIALAQRRLRNRSLPRATAHGNPTA